MAVTKPSLRVAKLSLAVEKACLSVPDAFRREVREVESKVKNCQAKPYKLLGADKKFYPSEKKGSLGGHRGHKIYGSLDCAGAKRWIEKGFYVKQRVFFADEETAVAAGYRPCARCLPEKYKKWKASIENK